MAKYRLIIDTNVYRKNPRRDNLPFSALSRLCKAGVVKLFIPHVVLREFQSQQSIQSKEHLASLVSAARSLERTPGVPADLVTTLSDLALQLTAREAEVATGTESEFQGWANDNGATVIELSADQANAAMEAYFKGTAPLKALKVRKDIPDALIFQAIRSIAAEPLTLLSDDGNFRTACAEIGNVTAFASLEVFIESEGVQDELKELDFFESIGPTVDALEAFDKETREFTQAVTQELGEALMWKKFTSRSIPDDNHEAAVSGYNEAEDVELDFDEATYFGGGEFGIPFTTTILVTGTYYLFKGNLYETEHREVSLSEHNDHFYEAEEEFELVVSGLLKVTCDRDGIDLAGIDAAIRSISIDSVDSLQLAEESSPNSESDTVLKVKPWKRQTKIKRFA